MVVAMEGSTDATGRITGWRHELWSNPHIARPGLQDSPSLLAAWHIDPPFPQPPGIDSLPGGKAASQRNALPLYDFANQKVVHYVLERLPVRTGTLRAIGAFLDTFAIECFMDELAASAGIDPIALRLAHLTEECAKAVINKACERSGLSAKRQRNGSRGMGEAVAGPTAAAIANAVFDAIGVRVRDLPLTRERLLDAINAA